MLEADEMTTFDTKHGWIKLIKSQRAKQEKKIRANRSAFEESAHRQKRNISSKNVHERRNRMPKI
jgi:hypothetical protein